MKRNSIDVLKNDAIIFGKIISEFRRPVSIYTMAKKLFSEDIRKSEAFLRWWFDKWKFVMAIRTRKSWAVISI